MIVFRHADPRYPFLWEEASQPPGRWHGSGEGPAHYFADTPTGAWAEFIRHEEIKDPQDLAFVLFGPQPTLQGWRAAEAGAPPAEALTRVRHF